MRKYSWIMIIACLLLVFPSPAAASSKKELVRAKLLVNPRNAEGEVTQGQITLGVHFDIAPGWHIYWRESGETGMPTKVEWTLPPGSEIEPLRWPTPYRFIERGDINTFGYESEVMLLANASLPLGASKVKAITIKAIVKWLACKDICIPGKAFLEKVITSPPTQLSSEKQALFERYEKETAKGMLTDKESFPVKIKHDAVKDVGTNAELPLLLALLYAFLGGLILNLMPCVLPVISIKIMGFVGKAEQPKKTRYFTAGAFCLGIVASFLSLAAIIVTLRSLGYSLGWGFQFQNFGFVLTLLLIVFILALGFFDIYTISLPYMRDANKAVSKLKSSFWINFFDGVLAVALATPCTAPFLGAALVVAFASSTPVTFAIFTSIGLGLAFPYAYLSTHPKLLKLLPAPGPWMHRVRQLMGFLLLGTVIWLLFVLSKLQEGAAIWALVCLLVIYFSFWTNSWAKEFHKTSNLIFISRLVSSLGFLVSALVIIVAFPSLRPGSESQSEIEWQKFSPEYVDSLLVEGKAVFIDFTADWCVTCKANEIYTISSEEVIQAINRHGIVPVKADWTTGDRVVTEALQGYGARGVPLYVVLSPNRELAPIVLSTLPSRSSLIEAFQEATASKGEQPNEQ